MNNGCYRRYKVGEKRLFEWKITPNSPLDTVVVTDAAYEIREHGDVVKTGKATVDGLNVSVLFEAESKGSFEIVLKVTVPPETFKTVAYVDVTG